MQPQEINLGQVDGERRFVIHLENQGDGLLTGTIAADRANWLAFGDAPGVPQKMFQCRSDGEMTVHVVGNHLRAGNKPVDGRIVIESNGGTATIQVRAEKAVQPFPEGVLAGAKAPREVAAKAKAHPKEAAALFEKGAVKAWYESNGWTYPVQGPSSSGLGAIQQFFEALGLVQPPKVTISQEKIEFEGNPGAFLEQIIRVQTVEKRPVFAHATTTTPWLQIGKPVHAGRTVSIPIRVPSNPATPGERLHGTVQVNSNGNQRFTVAVELSIAGSPVVRPSTTTMPLLDLSDALADAPLLDQSSEPPLALAIETEVAAVGATVVQPDVEEVETLMVVTASPPAAVDVLLEVLPAAAPLLEVLPAHSAALPAPKSGWPWSALHGLPVVLLVFFLFVPCLHDSVVWMWRRATQPPEPSGPQIVAPGVPRIELQFHDQEQNVRLGMGGVKPTGGGSGETRPAVWEPSMRFGVVQVADERGNRLPAPKRLTYKEDGTTNNTVVRLDGHEWIFGERPFREINGKPAGGKTWPGRWRDQDQALGLDESGGQRRGRRSVWEYEQQQISVTQTVEIVAGTQTGLQDTVLVRYLLVNEDRRPHRAGLRFLLDTFIGGNDGVPFLIPGQEQLCTTSMDFTDAQTMPDFIQARENEDLANPGTIAQVQLKVGGGLEAPSRVTLGAWPNPELAMRRVDVRCQQEKTMWEVPVLPIHTLSPGDSAVVLYWKERDLAAGERREVGFAYGLGNVSSGEGQGKLAVTVGGDFTPQGEFTVTAYVSNPTRGQTVTLSLPEEFQIIDERGQRDVPMPAVGATTRVSPVTWKVKGPRKPGMYSLKVESSTGASQSQAVRIQATGIFGSN